MPVAAIGKVRVPLVSSGYIAADTFSYDQIGAIRQRTYQGCAFARHAFFGVVPFLSYWPPKFTEATKKSVFGEKRPLNRRISELHYERIHRHMDSRIPAKFCRIR